MKKIGTICSVGVIVVLASSKLATEPNKTLRTSPDFLVDVIGHFEGCRSVPYVDPVGIKTVGIGHAEYCNDIKDKHYTDMEVARIFANDVWNAEQCVNKYFNGSKLPQGSFNALTSFVFNVGCTTARGRNKHTTIRKHALQGNYPLMCDSLKQWVYGTVNGRKVVLRGLVKRRNMERLECYKGL